MVSQKNNELNTPSMTMKSRLQRYLRIHSSRSRQSFDRFGDDLSQLLLSYLTFDDKLKFECVSKQWQQVIPQTVTDIKCDEKFGSLTEELLAKLLKKCPNITRIDIYLNFNKYLPIITQYCPYLRQIYIKNVFDEDISMSIFDKFFDVFAKQLQTIHVIDNQSEEQIKSLDSNLKKCTNILFFNYIGDYPDDELYIYRHFTNDDYFRKLNKLEVNIDDERMDKIFEQIVRLYGQQLTSLSIDIYVDILPTTSAITDFSSQMSRLTDLKINIASLDNCWPELVPKLLSPIGRNCRQLKHLSLTIESYTIGGNEDFNGSNLFQIICQNFKQLKRLYLSDRFLDKSIDFVGSDNTMTGFKKLTHLSILSKEMSPTTTTTTIGNNFIGNIVANCPRLQYLQYSGYPIDSNAVQSLKQLLHLQTIVLSNVDDKDIDLNQLKSCLKFIKKIVIC